LAPPAIEWAAASEQSVGSPETLNG
jgi:hypothetical protein